MDNYHEFCRLLGRRYNVLYYIVYCMYSILYVSSILHVYFICRTYCVRTILCIYIICILLYFISCIICLYYYTSYTNILIHIIYVIYIGRLKASYQLSEIVKTKNFIEWLELASDFTNKSLLNWTYSMNSIHYLLALWGRLVAALPYLRTDGTETQRQAQILRQCVLSVCESYIKTMLDSVDIVVASDGGVDDPLDDEVYIHI